MRGDEEVMPSPGVNVKDPNDTDQDVETKMKAAPVIFDQGEFEARSTYIDEKLNPVPHDLLRFNCTELENP